MSPGKTMTVKSQACGEQILTVIRLSTNFRLPPVTCSVACSIARVTSSRLPIGMAGRPSYEMEYDVVWLLYISSCRGRFVHSVGPLGNLMPETASSSELLPTDCLPTTTMPGRSNFRLSPRTSCTRATNRRVAFSRCRRGSLMRTRYAILSRVTGLRTPIYRLPLDANLGGRRCRDASSKTYLCDASRPSCPLLGTPIALKLLKLEGVRVRWLATDPLEIP